jgi:hypothetical protein
MSADLRAGCGSSALRSEEFRREAIEELARLHRALLDLMRAGELKPATREEGAEEIVIDLTTSQRHAASALLGSYREWFDRIRPFLGRSPTAPIERFDDGFALLGSYFALRRVASGVTDEEWRELFEAESTQVVRHQMMLLEQAKECFALLDPRPRKRIEDLAIRFHPLGGSKYRVAAESCRGDAEAEIVVPFDSRDLENFILRYCDPVRGPVRGWAPPSLRPYAEFGGSLFTALFSGEVRDLYMRHAAAMRAGEIALRIRLRFGGAPDLGEVPWEYLYDGTDFVALTGAASITRHVEADRPVGPMRADGPLRVAVTVSAPTDQVAIDADQEVAGLRMAVAPLVAAGLVRIDVAPDGTIGTLASMVRAAEAASNPFHVWHFIGHGRHLAREGATYLAFESVNGTSQMQSGFELGTLLSNHPSLRLAVLNACEGARAAPEDSLTSVGSALVARGLPAAIAMQFSITDTAAVRFAEDFYRALADDGCIDTAVGDARRGIFFMPNESEWATPVVLSRADDGVLFERP